MNTLHKVLERKAIWLDPAPWVKALKNIPKIGALLLLGISMSACSKTSWKEEVLLHDGSKIVVERSQIREGRHEIGQGPPIKESTLKFDLPGSQEHVTWKSEFSEDIGHANFVLLAMNIVNGIPYVIAEPMLCPSYNKWGRPNPPYIVFKYANQQWIQIPLTELPREVSQPNMLISTYGHGDVDSAIRQGFISTDTVKKLNRTLRQPEYKTILREPIVSQGPEWCPEMIYDGHGGWLGLDWFTEQPSFEACNQFCKQKDIQDRICPCASIFKRK